MLVIEMVYSKHSVFQLQFIYTKERTKSVLNKMQLRKLVAQEIAQKKKEKKRKRKQAEGLHENWRGWEPDRLNPQRQQAVWINVTSTDPQRATETQRAHPQDRSSRRREKVTAVWGEHLIDPCATGLYRHQITELRPRQTFSQTWQP